MSHKTLPTTLKGCIEELKNSYGIPLMDSYALIQSVVGLTQIELFLNFDRSISSHEADLIAALATRRSKHEPLAYLLKEVLFFGCKIHVSPAVLIPRFETEFLVEKILQRFPENTQLNVLDLCTGSGCIGLALKKNRPHWNVHMTDICPQALEVAKKNAKENFLAVNISQGDLFEPLEPLHGFFDLIVSNPPYIPEKQYLALEPSVGMYEPHLALTPGVTGLEIYEKISFQAHRFMRKTGVIALEIGFDQKDNVTQVFSNGFYKNILCEKDLAGHDRFIFLELQ